MSVSKWKCTVLVVAVLCASDVESCGRRRNSGSGSGNGGTENIWTGNTGNVCLKLYSLYIIYLILYYIFQVMYKSFKKTIFNTLRVYSSFGNACSIGHCSNAKEYTSKIADARHQDLLPGACCSFGEIILKLNSFAIH